MLAYILGPLLFGWYGLFPGPLLFGWYGLFLGPLLLVRITDLAGGVVPDLTATTP